MTATPEAQERALGEYGQIVPLLVTARQIALYAHRSELTAGPLFPGNAAVLEYLSASMGSLLTEQVRVLYLNASNELIVDEVVGTGTIDRAELHPREIIRRAIEMGALRLIVAHNHPSGNPHPSKSDVAATQGLARAAEIMGMELLDHIIVGVRGVTSLRAEGFLKNVRGTRR